MSNYSETKKMKKIKKMVADIETKTTLEKRSKTIGKIKSLINSEKSLLEELLHNLDELYNNHNNHNKNETNHDTESDTDSNTNTNSDNSENSDNSQLTTFDIHNRVNNIKELCTQLYKANDIIDKIDLFHIIMKKIKECKEYYNCLQMKIVNAN